MTDTRNDFQRRIGVGERSNAFARKGPTRRRRVIREEGPNRGTVGGYHTDHKDGRQDAHVYAEAVSLRGTAREL